MRGLGRRYLLRRTVKDAFDNLPSGICFFDSNGIAVLCNKQMDRLIYELKGFDVQCLSELQDIFSEHNSGSVVLVKGKAWRFRLDVASLNGVGYYTHNTMAGFIRLEPKYLDADPTDLTVTLSMPKQYVEKDSIRIPPFSTNSTITEYTIGSVEENGENYTISIYFTVYDRTQTLMLPFTLSFLDDVVPDNYRLPVTASVFAEDYEMQAGGQVRFHAYTVYRDPEHTHVPDGQAKVTYTNAARSINSYPLDGETNDKIAYAFSDATIIAAQSMYAEKFIAPAGSDSWSKQGLLVKAGSGFDYLLEIVNETAAVHTGLTVYDTLPRIGDPNLFGASGRLRIPGPPARRHHAAGGLYGLLHHERRCLHPFHGGDGERRYLGSHSLRLRVRHRLQARRRGRDRAGRELKIPGPDPGMRAEDL